MIIRDLFNVLISDYINKVYLCDMGYYVNCSTDVVLVDYEIKHFKEMCKVDLNIICKIFYRFKIFNNDLYIYI